MNSYEIYGGRKLLGEVEISGAKNAALPLMAASLLTQREMILHNIPLLSDIFTMVNLLRTLGKEVDIDGHSLIIRQRGELSLKAPYEIVRAMRASIVVLGPLLAKYRKAEVAYPGGCSIGNRPVDLHLKAMELMGAEIRLENGYIFASAPKGLTGAELNLVSSTGITVLGTANALMAATLASGKTVIEPAAMEPEIGALVDMLIAMGANIQGKNTRTLTVKGVPELGGGEHTVIPDRIETGTFLAMVACTGGDLTMRRANPTLLQYPLFVAKQMGVQLEFSHDVVRVVSHGNLKPADISTEPYPNFPTDMQPQYMVMQSLAQGESGLSENIFEDRLHHVPELVRMGADIRQQGANFATIRGVPFLTGAPVRASDLRAGAALVIAGLSANGKTIVEDIEHIDRGYEKFEEKIRALEGDIRRINQ